MRLKDFFPFLWSPVLLFSVLFPYVEQRVWSGFAFWDPSVIPNEVLSLVSFFTSPKKGVFRPILDLSFSMLSSPLQNLECFSWQFSASFSQVRWAVFFLDAPPMLSFNCPSSPVLFKVPEVPFRFSSALRPPSWRLCWGFSGRDRWDLVFQLWNWNQLVLADSCLCRPI